VCFYINRHVAVTAMCLRKSLDHTVSVLRHLALQLLYSWITACQSTRLHYMKVEFLTTSLRSVRGQDKTWKPFLQFLIFSCVVTHTGFSFPKTSDQAHSSFVVFPYLIETTAVWFVSVDRDNFNSAFSSKFSIHTVYSPFWAIWRS
jgi:hypothetical protein